MHHCVCLDIHHHTHDDVLIHDHASYKNMFLYVLQEHVLIRPLQVVCIIMCGLIHDPVGVDA